MKKHKSAAQRGYDEFFDEVCLQLQGKFIPKTEEERIVHCELINAVIVITKRLAMSPQTDAGKALKILKAFHDMAHNSEKDDGITITKDWDLNTITVYYKDIDGHDIHSHFGQMNKEDEEGFSILITQLYETFAKKMKS